MKSKGVQRLLRALIALLGAGLGMALTLGVLQLYSLTKPEFPVPLKWALAAYISTALVFGAIFFLLSNAIIAKCIEWGTAVEKRMDKLTFGQLIASTGGLICGMLIAALVSQILSFMGQSVFTTAFSAILFVVLGVTGFTLGFKRAGDVSDMLERVPVRSGRRHRKGDSRDEADRPRIKLLDTSALIDGRIFDVCRLGFLEGELIVPCFVMAELMRVADSADALRRSRGRRGLEVLRRLKDELGLPVRTDGTDYDDLTEPDVKLLRLAQELDGAIVSGDGGLYKAACAAGVRALSLNELAFAMRPAVAAGDELTVQIVKEGKEPGQGVAYMPDGTMLVVEGGRRLLGESAAVVVTSVLQTSAGRMVFAKVK